MPEPWSGDSISRLRQIVGDIGDNRLSAILALNPTIEEIEEAASWADGCLDTVEDNKWPLTGKVGLIFDILTSEPEDELP